MSTEQAAFIRAHIRKIIENAARTHDQIMEAGGECDGNCGWEELSRFLQMWLTAVVDQYMACRYAKEPVSPVRRYNLELAIDKIAGILLYGPDDDIGAGA